MLTMTMQHYIDTVVETVTLRTFVEDPVLGPRLSRLHSMLGSVIKRDGHIIQRAIADALGNVDHLTVWREARFPVTAQADRLADAAGLESCLETSLPLTGPIVRTVRVDACVIDHRTATITCLETKRGNACLDAGKRRQTLRDILCVAMLSRAYAASRSFKVDTGCARVLAFHGRVSLPPVVSLTGEELDDYFGAPVRDAVVAASDYYSRRIRADLPNLLALPTDTPN